MNAPVTIPVTIELCAEDRARLDSLTQALNSLLSQITPPTLTMEPMKHTQAAQEAPTAPAAEQPTVNPPEAEQPEPAAPAKPDEPEKAVTADDIRALVQKLVAPITGKRDKAKAIVTKYAPSVSEIPADKFGEVFAALKALEVEA